MAAFRFRLIVSSLLNGVLLGIFFIVPLYLIVYGWIFTMNSDAHFSDVLYYNQNLNAFHNFLYIAQVLVAAVILSLIAGLLTAIVSGDEIKNFSGAVKVGAPTGLGVAALISLCACSIIFLLSNGFGWSYTSLVLLPVLFVEYLIPLLVFLVPSAILGVHFCTTSAIVDLKSQWCSGPINFILLLTLLMLIVATVPQIVMLLAIHVF